ncbi:LysR family transcriptional regulator [Aeromonas bestiarum]|uniref:LysR family transcriptional regulator n=1 Tax=Aeromonas bestiarum TaxID=105751 RepID=UPI0032B1BCC6
MDQLDAMRMFMRVAELESFTRSAEQLGMPKATLSAAIRRLEEQLGTRLLHRTTRRVQLTTDGQLCYARSQELLADMEEFNGLFRQGGQLSGQLRVDMPSRMARPLGHYRQINCASAAYLARHGTPQTLVDLAQHRLVHYGAGPGSREAGFEYVQADGTRTVLAMAGTLTVSDSEAYLAAAQAGLGIIQLPGVGVEPLLASGELVAILPQWQAPPLPIHALYAHRRQLSPRVRAFIHWLSEVLDEALAGGSAVVT